MTPAQRFDLIERAKRYGVTLAMVVAALSWGLAKYDATLTKRVEFKAHSDTVAWHRVTVSLERVNYFRELQRRQSRIDSAVRLVCVKVRAGC